MDETETVINVRVESELSSPTADKQQLMVMFFVLRKQARRNLVDGGKRETCGTKLSLQQPDKSVPGGFCGQPAADDASRWAPGQSLLGVQYHVSRTSIKNLHF